MAIHESFSDECRDLFNLVGAQYGAAPRVHVLRARIKLEIERIHFHQLGEAGKLDWLVDQNTLVITGLR